MSRITQSATREIIGDFAQAIKERKTPADPPYKWVIDFRDDRKRGKERDVYLVPIDLLRYRKDNGRISSDVLGYEEGNGYLSERSEEAQRIIRKFLEEKDAEKTKELEKLIKHDGQREPAIITCDGFLINGNRRKMVMEKLASEDDNFARMRAVILPGKGEEGGPPTVKEIEQIENRYQLQSEGKAEYSGFDRALSVRRKINWGFTLEQQLRDDPIYSGLSDRDFKKEIKKFEEDYLKPLYCVDRYLNHLGRPGLYGTVAAGLGDREGRWQAFIDYYKSVYKNLEDEKKRIKIGIDEDEIGDIEDVAFKIIRKRTLKDLPKVHEIMRQMGRKWLGNKDSKKRLITLVDIPLELSSEDPVEKGGNEFDERMVDRIWGNKYHEEIQRHVKEAKNLFDHREELETPLTLLREALKKLNHENMDPESIDLFKIKEAMTLTEVIEARAHELRSELYSFQKKQRKLVDKHKRR